MTKAKHTPGPWSSHATGFYQNPFKVLAHRRTGAVANIPRSTIARDGEQEANAHLIAAAPDMLSALEGMVEMATHHMMEPEERREMLRNARAAIAKAKVGQAQ